MIQRWDLTNCERELSIQLDVNADPQAIAIGVSSEGPIAIGIGGRVRDGLRLIDLQSLRPIAQDEKGVNAIQRLGVSDPGVELRASADGSVFTAWSIRSSPSGVGVLKVNGTFGKSSYSHVSLGPVLPNHNGSKIYTSGGVFQSEMEIPMATRSSADMMIPIPAVRGPYYLRMQRVSSSIRFSKGGSRTATLHIEGHDAPLLTMKDFGLGDVFPQTNRTGRTISFDRRLNFSTDLSLIATLPPSNDRIHIRKFNLGELLNKADVDYLFVDSQPPVKTFVGSALDYPINVRSKRGEVQFELMSGPKGMSVSDEGRVRWSATGTDAGTESIIVAIKDASGQQIFHTFRLEIRSPKQSDSADKIPISQFEMRTWTDATGEHKTEARLLRIVGDEVLLIRVNGKEARVPIKRLSVEDQKYLTRFNFPKQ